MVNVPNRASEAPREVLDALVRLELLGPGEPATFTPLTGGVSSDIWKVATGSQVFCVKRALPKLKVAQDWRAPVERSRAEWDWFRTVRSLAPNAAPQTFGYDEDARLSVIGYYPPSSHRLWKGELATGRADPGFARQVGASLAVIHAGTAGNPEVARRFDTDATFHAIRLEPYLLATARVHPDLGGQLEDLARRTGDTKRALVHGDVSPKNIFVAPTGPMFLDAECAWYGDPAFDPAFCLNHLLLKCLLVPAARAALLACFDALSRSYLAAATWEDAGALEARIAHVLPGLLLARVDGKSPVEYVIAERDKARVRKVARHYLEHPSDRLLAVREAWAEELTQ